MKRSSSVVAQLLRIVGGSVLLLLPFLLYVWGHLQIVETGYRIEQIEQRIGELEQQSRALRLEKARLEAAPRIEERARELGFEPLKPTRLTVLVDSRTHRPPAPPPTPTPRAVVGRIAARAGASGGSR